ncbi:ribosomal protein S18-alanine N-acetyltransferase [Paenibacillus sp. SC116]|uniref:ribosomal protein S18-alanine N-acetyltransferase n=1 Tax=Paenibacillus sp. SC116 TaxID=2968986 RepID=UPI00215B75DA|nr:ribosomal protein S18-alanine N-acetyltransferase [Paenibacillus sp. SC116]MCR8844148.1 ribosomal protein S18-alanine N-acetyltransferase [Paenibacillus sp. SC116]
MDQASHHFELARVRPMTVADIEAVQIVEQASFTLPWTNDAFYNELTNNIFAHYWVIEENSTIIAYAGMWTVIDEAHVTNIAVHPDSRGHGYGEKLMQTLITEAAVHGMNKMTLEVRVTNEVAQRLYRKYDFEPAGVRKGYYSDNNEDALIMWTNIDQLRVSSY